MLTRQRFDEMLEDELCKQVLVPLLRAMGYRDVYYSHGGSGEKGKDIVCWKEDELGSRENLAIVAKAKQVTGKANPDKGTAGEIQTQIRQCFGSAFLDPVNGETRYIHRCWVMCNKKIGKEAEEAILAAVESPLMIRNTRFTYGDKLWELVEEYLPLTFWEQLKGISERIAKLNSPLVPNITITGSGVAVTLIPRENNSTTFTPITTPIRLPPPVDESAKAFREAFRQHVETGEPLHVPLEFTDLFIPPDEFFRELGFANIRMERLELLSVPSSHEVSVRIELLAEDGKTFIFPLIRLHVTKAGTKEVTLENITHLLPLPVQLRLVLRHEERSGSINIKMIDKEMNAYQLNELLRLHSCLCQPIIVRVYHAETNMPLFEMAKSTGELEQPDQNFMRVVDDLAQIQTRTKRVLNIPSRDFTVEERGIIRRLQHILHTGQIEGKWNDFSITLEPTPESIKQIVATFGNGREGFLRVIQEEVELLFGAELPIGPVQYTMSGAVLTNEDELHSRYEELIKGDGIITLRFHSSPSGKMVQQFQNWVSTEDPEDDNLDEPTTRPGGDEI